MTDQQSWRRALAACVLGICCAGVARGEVRLPPIIGDNMLLQQEVPAKIWGWADAGEKVTITLGDQAVATVEGKGEAEPWRVELPPLSAGPAPDLVIAGANTIRISNILVGEVWLCSGQSNMEMTVRAIGRAEGADLFDPTAKTVEAANPQIRLFDKKWDRWLVCTDESGSSFSAVGYYFGRDLQRELSVPVGLIGSSVGGTKIEPWTPLEYAVSHPEFQPAFAEAHKYKRELPELQATYESRLRRWEAETATSRTQGLQVRRAPRKPHPPFRFEPGGLFQRQIAPLVPYTIRGVAWYQGESNRDDGMRYAPLLSTMIQAWRDAFQNRTLPFLIVQIANYNPSNANYFTDPESRENLARLRAAQAEVARMTNNAALITTIDIGEPDDIHPRNKQEVGRRLMLAALKTVYGREDVVASGPSLNSARIEDGKAVIYFDNARGGIKPAGEKLLGFELAGEDQVFYPAEAEPKKDAVYLTSANVPRPRLARYGWADSPTCNVVNMDGLPAVPFQTKLAE